MPSAAKRIMSWQGAAAGAVAMAILIWIAGWNYLLFHALAEISSIAIAVGTFFVAWSARHVMKNGYLLFMGMSYLFVAFLDVLHTLAYKGMGVFPGYGQSNLPTQLWIAARYMESLALLTAPAFLRLKLPLRGALTAFVALTVLILLSIFTFQNFPECFVEGHGLTRFKIVSEYIICGFLSASAVLLWRNRQCFDEDVLALLLLSILGTIISELCFTMYAHPFAFSNELGHLFKVLSFFLMYKAIIVTGVERPYALVFHDLSKEVEERKRAEELLQIAHSALEERIAERTRELTETNEKLLLEIQERKRAEDDRARVNAALEAKNAELEQVVYVASHDLRSPLVNIGGYSKELGFSLESLRHELSLLPVGKEALLPVMKMVEGDIPDSLRFILTSTAKMDALLNGLLRLSRSGRAELFIETLDMNALVSKIVDSTEYAIKQAGIRIEVSELPPCRGDEVQVGQVLSNLLDNAVKFLDPDRPGIIRISGKVVDGRSVYCVEDNGIGIADKDLGRIFEIFQRIDPGRCKGEGLGLTIVKHILGRLGGDVRVESEAGTGSRFYVELPASGAI